jgi:hypothetical protein
VDFTLTSKEDIDSYKEAICKTSSKALRKVMWLPKIDEPTKGS